MKTKLKLFFGLLVRFVCETCGSQDKSKYVTKIHFQSEWLQCKVCRNSVTKETIINN